MAHICTAIFYYISLIFILSFPNGTTSKHCNFNVQVKQAIRNEGFHKNMTYGVVFNNDNNGDAWLHKDCILSIEQELPPGVFVNPDELNELRRQRRLNAVPNSKIDIELTAEKASTSTIFVIGRVNDGKAYLWLPVHARYHKAIPQGGLAYNYIPYPKLYLRCPDQRLDVCDKPVSPGVAFLCNGSAKGKCSWKEIPYDMNTDKITWKVPVGNMNHYYVVTIGTGAIVTLGSLYIIKRLHEFKKSLMKLKQN